MAQTETAQALPPIAYRSRVLDAGRAVGVLLVAFVHWSEQVLGRAYAGNPNEVWPDLHTRISQWALRSGSPGEVASAVVERCAWSLNQAVGWFFITTVVVLGLGVHARNLDLGDRATRRQWWQRRYAAVYPSWGLAHLIMLAAVAVTGGGVLLLKAKWWLSILGLRAVPQLLYYLVPAWWYFTLLIQLYLVFPLVMSWVADRSPKQILAVGLPVALAVRTAGFLVLPPIWWDDWARGGLILSRLGELVVGLAIVAHLRHSRQSPDAAFKRLASRPVMWVLSPVLLFAGIAAGFTLFGNVISPLLVVAGLSMPAGMLALRLAPALGWLQRRTLGFYLMHQIPFLLLLGPATVIDPGVAAKTALALALGCLLTEIAFRIGAPATGWLVRRGAGARAVP